MSTVKCNFKNRAGRMAVLVAITALTATSAPAHYLWLERDAKGAKLYFGEVAEVREKSPGRMDEIKAPTAWTGQPAAALAVSRTGTHFALTGAALTSAAPAGAPAPQLLATETGYEVKDWTKQGIGIVKPMYYARHSAWPVAATPEPQLKLDIVPVGGSSNTFQVFLGGKPLVKAKVNLYAPNDWMQDHNTGADGTVKLPLPWRGQYVLEVIQKEEVPGEFDGRKFDAYRHRATLTVFKRDGLSFKGTGGGASWGDQYNGGATAQPAKAAPVAAGR